MDAGNANDKKLSEFIKIHEGLLPKQSSSTKEKDEIVKSLLMELIANKNMSIFKELLTLCEGCLENHIFYRVKENEYNPLLLSLMDHSELFTNELVLFLEKNNYNKLESISKYEILILASIIKLPYYEYMIEQDFYEYLKEKVLKLIYCEDALKELENHIVNEIQAYID